MKGQKLDLESLHVNPFGVGDPLIRISTPNEVTSGRVTVLTRVVRDCGKSLTRPLRQHRTASKRSAGPR